MSLSPMTGAPLRAADASPLLACIEDGIWLWPGTPLTEKFGRAIRPLAKAEVLAHATKFWGHAAHYSSLYQAVEVAAEALSKGDLGAAAEALARTRLPLVSSDGLDLIQAIAIRLGIVTPPMSAADGPRLWTADNIRTFAALYDRFAKTADALEDVFQRATSSLALSKYNHDHDPKNGQFTSANDAGQSDSSTPQYKPGYGVSHSGPNKAGKYDLKDADGNLLEGTKVFRNSQGKSECVTLVQGVLGAPGASVWQEGMKVNSKTVDQIPIGAPIATFVDGRYPMTSGNNMHTGLYAGHDDKGIFLLEEDKRLTHIQTTYYPWVDTRDRPHDTAPRIRSAINYSVVEWSPHATPKKVSR